MTECPKCKSEKIIKSGINYISILFSKGNPNPTVGMKLICAVIISLLPISMLIGGGLKAVQTMVLVLALPVTVVLLMTLVSIVYMIKIDPNAKAELKAQLLDEKFIWRDPTISENEKK